MNGRFPNFLGIGVQKSGTRWLYNQLKLHPDIYLPPVKELHYFDNVNKNDRIFDERGVFKMLHQFYHVGYKCPIWFRRYYFGKMSNQWYESLFQGSVSDISGEITPAYSSLSAHRIKAIYRFNSDMRLILLLRNPADRAWSHFRMQMQKEGVKYESLKEEEVFSWLNKNGIFRKGDYLRTIQNWTSHFPMDQLFVGYFDQVKSEPASLLSKIYEHLGASQMDTMKILPKTNEGVKIQIPDKYEDFLRSKYQAQNEQLYDLLGDDIIRSW